MEVSSYFPSVRHRNNLQLQEPVEHSTPKCSQVKGHFLRKNTPPPSVDTDNFPHRGRRRPLNNQILELIDQEVAKCKSHLSKVSAPPDSRCTTDTHSPTKVSVSVLSPSNADREATTSNFEQVEVPRQSPSFQPFSASKQLQEEEELIGAYSEPGCSSAETTSRHSEFLRQAPGLDGTEIKENIPVVNREPPRLNPAADHTRQSRTSTEQEHSRIVPQIAVEDVSLLCSKAAVSPQNKPEGGICQNPRVQISENPVVSTLTRSPQPILYEDISEDETEIYLEKSPCPPEWSDAEEDADPCNVLDFDGDEEDDGDWEVLPLSILNLQFQPSNQQVLLDNEGKERAWGSRQCGPFANVIPASAFTQMKVFDTPDQQEGAVTFGKLSFVIPPINEHHLVEVESRENCSDLEDCCDTEDSNDYSSGPESNLMTVSLQCLKNLSALSPESKFEKETKEKTTTPEKGWKVEGQKHQNPVIVLDSSDESDDNLELTKLQPAPDGSENNHTNQSKMDVRRDTRDKVSSEDLDRTEEYGKNMWKDEGIIILSDSDDDQPQNQPQETTKCSSAASPSQNPTADSSAGCPEPETATKESGTKKFKKFKRKRALPAETQPLEINAKKCTQQASPVKIAEKQSTPEHQISIVPQFYPQKHPNPRIQLVQRPDTQRQPEDPSNPIPPSDRFKEDMANQRVKRSVLRSKSHPSSAAPAGQKSVSFSVSSTSKPSNSSEGRPPSRAQLPLNPAKSKVCSDWQESFFSIRKKTKDQKEGDSKTKASNLPAETRPRPARVPKRRNSHDPAPLMKKTKLNAMEYIRARNCNTAIDPKYPVGKGYKWKNSAADGSKNRVGRHRSRKHRSESPFSDSSF